MIYLPAGISSVLNTLGIGTIVVVLVLVGVLLFLKWRNNRMYGGK